MTGCGREPHLHVYPERAMWRWTYHEPDGADGQGLELRSSIAFADAEEARSSATTAYPGIPVADDAQPDEAEPDEESPRKHRCRRTVPAVLAAAVLVATAVIILRQRSVDDHGDRPDRTRFPIESGPGLRLRFRLRRPRVSETPRRLPVPASEDAVMVDMTKCSAALPRGSRVRRVGGRR